MNTSMQKGQQGIEGLILGVVALVIFLPAITLLLGMITNTTCQTWITQLNTCQQEKEACKQQYGAVDANYQACLVSYDALEKTKITKDDFALFNGNLEKILIQNQQITNNISTIQEQINYMQNISNSFFTLGILITIELSLFSLAFIDILFFKFKHTKHLITKIYSWRNKTEIKIEEKPKET